MNFDPEASFEDNMAVMRAEADRLDPDCARILFDNLSTLSRAGDVTRTRQAVQEFNQAILVALEGLPEVPTT